MIKRQYQRLLTPPKRNFDAEILDVETKYFTTPDYNKFTSEIHNTNIKERS